MGNCVMCGAPLPKDQGSRTCSMCYGDPWHGKDGYYLCELEREEEALANAAKILLTPPTTKGDGE